MASDKAAAEEGEKKTTFGGIFDRLFVPDPNGVRLRDVVREIPAAAKEKFEQVGDFGRAIAQGTARTGGSVGLSFNNAVSKLTGSIPSDKIPVEDGTEAERWVKRILFGEDVESLGLRVEKAPERATKFAEQFGVKEQKVVNKMTAPFFVLGLTALDFTSGGGKKQVVNRLAKTNKVQDIFNILKKEVKGVDPDITYDLATKLTKVSKAKDVENILDVAIKNQSGIDFIKPKITTKKVEDLIKKRTRLFHGSNQPITEFKSAKQLSEELGEKFIPSNIGGRSKFTFFTEDKKMADQFAKARAFNVEGAGGAPQVTEGFVEGKIIDLSKEFADITQNEAKLLKQLGDALQKKSTMFVDPRIGRSSGIGGADGAIMGELRTAARRAGKGMDSRRMNINFNDLDRGESAFADVLKDFDISGFKFGDRDTIGRFIKAQAILPDAVKSEKQLIESFGKIDEPLEASVRFADDAIKTQRERGFITTVKQSPNATDEVKKALSSNYNPLNNDDLFARARNIVETDINKATRIAKDPVTKATAESNAISQLLIQKAQQAGNWEEAIDLVEITAKKGTEAGQAIQALSAFNRLTPEGVLRFTQRTFSNANKLSRTKKLAKKLNLKLTDDLAKELTKKAREIEDMPDGEDKIVATAELMTKINEQIPVSIGQKIATVQTLAQLLNPKTLIRNIGGNTGFSVLENISDVVGAAFDSPLSIITGKRAKTLPSMTAQAKGFKEGLRQGIRDALHGIDTAGVPTRFDLPKTPVFKGKVGRAAEKTLNFALRVPDRAAYKAAYDGSLFNQMKAAAKSKKGIFQGDPTDAMKEIAHHDALYRTFQDDNMISRAFIGIKKALNLGQDFGMGDIVLKYPRTPANLLARGIDYSPAGFINTMLEASSPLFGKTFDQKAFVESFSRVLTGTGSLVGMGALMHRMGIITGKREKDIDISQVQRISGLGQYKLNASAMKRLVASGFDVDSAKPQKGDTLYTYDWFQPAAIGISIGANIDENHQAMRDTEEKIVGPAMAMIEGVAEGFNTLGEQPLVQNITRLLKYGEVSEAVKGTVKQIPRSFIPTLLSQINQYVDNKARNVYDPNLVKEAYNGALQRIPGAAQTLPPQVGVFGNDLEMYQNGKNNLFNVFLNPSFRSEYNPTPESKLVLDLYELTGETKQAPRKVSKTTTVNGKKIKLGPKTITQMQRFIGTQSRWYFNMLANSPDFQKLTDEEKINHMSGALTNIGKAMKIVILGDQPKKNPGYAVQTIIAGYLSNPNKEQLIEIEQK